MTTRKYHPNKIRPPQIDEVETAMNVASATEETGLLQAMPGQGDDAGALDAIAGTHAPTKKPEERRCDGKKTK